MPLPRLFERKKKPEIISRVKTIRSVQDKQVSDAIEAGLYPARVASRKGVKLFQFAVLSLVVSLLIVIIATVSGILEPLRTVLQPVRGETGGLIVSSEFVKVRVKLDGKELGVSPYNGQNIASGQHTLRVETVENTNNFWTPTEIPIVITTGNTTVVTMNPAPSEGMVNYTVVMSQNRSSRDDAKLIVKSIPADARVLIDDVAAGTAPLVLSDIASGNHKVTIERSGYKSATAEVSLTDDKSVTIEVRLYKYQIMMNEQ